MERHTEIDEHKRTDDLCTHLTTLCDEFAQAEAELVHLFRVIARLVREEDDRVVGLAPCLRDNLARIEEQSQVMVGVLEQLSGQLLD